VKRETLQKILSTFLNRLSKIEYVGLENLPQEGGLLVATNHMSRSDALLLLINPARTDITALVADKYQKYPFFNWVLRTAEVIWLDRDKADFAAFRLAVDVLKSGVALGIAPEGTRSKTGQLLEGKPGTVLLAQKAGVPIVPVGIAGTESFFRRVFTLRRPKVTISFGEPFTVPPMDRAKRDEWLSRSTEDIMLRIAAQLPPKYWGFYKDHPRLEEFVGADSARQAGKTA
jgi:1-acyl-sn-glycerol-3-phosphate acyltransferase